MRGRQEPQVTMLAFVDMEERVPADHPLRTIKVLADEALARLSPEFDRMYAEVGRPSIPPERLLKASLLIALFSVRSERAFCEELDYNLLFRWFLGMQLLERSFDATVFTKNRLRLLEHQVGQQLFDEVVLAADRRSLLSDEHFTVDGTLIEAAASLKSFKPRGADPSPDDGDRGNPSVDFHGDRRANATHQSATDPEARLFRKGKGKEARLVFMAHALMENRNGLLVDFLVSEATGTAERDAVPVLLAGARERGFHPRTLGGDKGLRPAGLRGGHAHPRGDPARGAKHERALQRYRWTHDPASRLCAQSASEEAGRGDLRVDEDGGRVPEDALPRSGPHGPCRLPRGDSLQSGADGEADDC